MKTGKSLIELATEIERQSTSKKDFIAPANEVTFHALHDSKRVDDNVVVHLGDKHSFGVNKIAHQQFANHTGIPVKYYERMRAEKPELLVENLNSWLQADTGSRMVRTLDGNVRAFLSDKYRPLENAELAEAVLPVLVKAKIQVFSCEVTESRLYIKGVDESVQESLPSGRRMGDGSHHIFDTVSPGIVISNSEVGMGTLSVETAVWTRACTNMAIFSSHSMRKYHVGAKYAVGEGLQELLTDKTKRLTDAAMWAQVQDVVKGAFDRARFDALLQPVREMAGQKIVGDPVKAIELTSRHFNFTGGEETSVLRHLIEGGDLTRYGLFNAVTRTAEDLDDYDRATEFERVSGQIIDLGKNAWKAIAEAA